MTNLTEVHPHLSTHVRHWAQETREEARGYKYWRNILFIGITAATALSNKDEYINSLPPVDQLKFNAGGIAIASLSALGMEYGRRKRERYAREWDEQAEELESFNL